MTTALHNPKSPRHAGRFGPASLDDLTDDGRRLLDACYQSCRAFLARCPTPPADADAGLYRALYWLVRYSGLVAAGADVQHAYNALSLIASVVHGQEEVGDPYALAKLTAGMVEQLKGRVEAAERNAAAWKRRAEAAEQLVKALREQDSGAI